MSEERKERLKAQFATAQMTAGDVDAAYRLCLGRPPAAGEPYNELVGKEPKEALAHFLALPEFRQSPTRIKIIAAAAKAAMEIRQSKASA